MDLDSRQSRRLFLAGTVAFPMPFPATGVISIQKGNLHFSHGGEPQHATFVVVQEKPGSQRTTLRVIRIEDVAAIFFPGTWQNESASKRVFHFARGDRVEDLEQGEWFLNPEIDAAKIHTRLKIHVTNQDSDARGVVFVPEHRPVLSITEVTQTAGSTGNDMHVTDLPRCECPCLGCETE
jgi:hypothetical protein